MYNIIEYINDSNTRNLTVVWFYFADYVAVWLCTDNGLQKKTDQIERYVGMILICWLCRSVFVYR
jgi:hypothetical protein